MDLSNGLLGLGGLGGFSPKPAQNGLLAQYMDPEAMQKAQLKRAMLQAGIGMLQGSEKGFGTGLAQGLAGGLQGYQGAEDDFLKNAQMQYGFDQQARQDARANTEYDWKLEERARQEEQRKHMEEVIGALPPELQGFAKADPEGFMSEYTKRKAFPDIPKPTDDQQEYGAAVKQGFQGSFMDYMTHMKKAGASSVTVNGGDGSFDKELSKGVANAYVTQMESGQNAVATKNAAQQLRVLMKDRGGALDGLTAATAPYLPPGLVPEGANDIVAAQSIIAGLIPKQRVPGSGSSSDFDARKFAESLPNIWNKPGANEIITSTLESYADYQIAVSNVIADVASNPQITNKSAAIREQMAKIPDPFVGWKQYTSGKQQPSSISPIDDLVNKYRTK